MRAAALVLVLPACIAAAQVRIALPPQVTVPPGPVSLGDIAQLSGPELDPVRRLSRVPLGLAPRPGDPWLITRAQLDAAARRVAPSGPGLHWDGASVTRVDVESPAWAVRRGQWAALQSDAGAVRAQLRVEVLQDGRPGDRVLVRHAAGGPAVRGRVLDATTLELMP